MYICVFAADHYSIQTRLFPRLAGIHKMLQ